MAFTAEFSMGAQTKAGPIISGASASFDFSPSTEQQLPKKGGRECSLVHSFTRSLARSLRAPGPTHTSPSGTERERAFPFLTPITHEVLIPYDGCQSPAVYISSTLLHPLIFLSSLPCDYSHFFSPFLLSLKSLKESDGWGP